MWSYISFCVEEQGHEIKDEYGEAILPEVFFAIVWDRHAKQLHDAEWLRMNHAQPGPFGLARHLVDGQHCIGHAGQYAPIDYIVGEFSWSSLISLVKIAAKALNSSKAGITMLIMMIQSSEGHSLMKTPLSKLLSMGMAGEGLVRVVSRERPVLGLFRKFGTRQRCI
jgi:hypothetical protein